MSYELTEEQKDQCASHEVAILEHCRNYGSLADGFIGNMMICIARAIAEPLAAQVATLETLNESAKGQIKEQADRIAQVEAMRDTWFTRHEAMKLANECCEKRIAELEAALRECERTNDKEYGSITQIVEQALRGGKVE